MNREEAIYKAKHLRKVHPSICVDSEDFWETVIAALEQEPCDDCISREAAESLLKCGCGYEIYNLPSVQPKQRTGRWVVCFDDLFPAESYMECSECGDREPLEISGNYCPHCGAKMSERSTSCSTCILDKTDACTRGAGRAVDDEACEDYLASPTGAEGSEE